MCDFEKSYHTNAAGKGNNRNGEKWKGKKQEGQGAKKTRKTAAYAS